MTYVMCAFQAYDDMDLPCGVLRLQPKGGYGRHNGLVDVVESVGMPLGDTYPMRDCSTSFS